MLVRRARPEEAREAAAVIRRSIIELCDEEYRQDRCVLVRWLANKTEANMRRWIADPNRAVFVAIAATRQIAAVGMVANGGEIQLNYVAPPARFTGAGKALMARMEAYLHDLGLAEARLDSSPQARRFYRALGWEERGPVASRFGTLDSTAMVKRLG
ncbi:MAG: GNAT family N-acetyltransferase [Paracraurococcus sp.]